MLVKHQVIVQILHIVKEKSVWTKLKQKNYHLITTFFKIYELLLLLRHQQNPLYPQQSFQNCFQNETPKLNTGKFHAHQQ